MILVGPFQFGIFHDSVIQHLPVRNPVEDFPLLLLSKGVKPRNGIVSLGLALR